MFSLIVCTYLLQMNNYLIKYHKFVIMLVEISDYLGMHLEKLSRETQSIKMNLLNL